MSDLIKIARERLDGTQSSHWEGCERDHRECLIQRMADEIERLRAALIATLPIVQAERERLALADTRAFRIIVNRVAELDAVIAQADAALGAERD